MNLQINYKITVFLVVFLLCGVIFSQDFSGTVFSIAKKKIDNAYLSNSKDSILAITNENGYFSIQNLKDKTVYIKSYGYKDTLVNIDSVKKRKQTVFYLDFDYENATLETVTILSNKSISEEFAIKNITKADVYTSPESFGDIVRTINSLPASSSPSETAEIKIRGTNQNNSILFLNRVPLYEPIKNGSLVTNTGVFSIVNTESVEQLNFYSSNPPLDLGRSTSGLTEIYTVNKIEANKTAISLGLSNVGVLHVNKLDQKSFFQVFTNYSNSQFFLDLNQEALPNVNSFNDFDLGLNTKVFLNEKNSINFYSYHNRVSNDFESSLFNFRGDGSLKSTRNLNILNIDLVALKKQKINFSFLYEDIESDFSLGNLTVLSNRKNIFLSSKTDLSIGKNKLSLGADYEHRSINNQSTIPVIPFNFFQGSPVNNSLQEDRITTLQLFAFNKYKFSKQWFASLGLRTNFDINQPENNLLNTQLLVKYNLDNENSFFLGLGNYSNYIINEFNTNRVENNFQNDFLFSKSKQISVDYKHQLKYNNFINCSLYYLKIKTNQIDREQESYGVELFYSNTLLERLDIKTSISIFESTETGIFGKSNSENDISPIYKFTANYNFNKVISSLGILLNYNQGSRYTPLSGVGIFEGNPVPLFEQPFSGQLNEYLKIDLTVNKVFTINNTQIISYATLGNIFDRANERERFFNFDYSAVNTANFSGRLLYFGMTINFL